MSGKRIVLLGAAALALFSALYSLAAWYDRWPRLPPGALHDTDLWAGILGGLLLLYCLIRAKSADTETRNHGDSLNSPRDPASADPGENALEADAPGSHR